MTALVLLVAASAIIATGLAAAWGLHRSATRQWQERSSALSVIVAEHAAQAMFSAHMVLDSLSDLVRDAHLEDQDAWVSWASAPARHETLVERTRANPIIDVATFVAADGRGLNFTRSYPMRTREGRIINLADRDYFRAHVADPTLRTFVSAPVRNRGNGKWVFYLTRRVDDARGQMLGLILVGVSVEVFARFYERSAASIGEGVSIGLYRDDGTLLTRWPLVDELIGQRDPIGVLGFPGDAAAPVNASGQSGARQGVDAFHAQGIAATAAVPGYPMIVAPFVPGDVYLLRWRQQFQWIGLGSAFGLLLVLIGSRMLFAADRAVKRQLADRRAAEAVVRAARDELIAMIDAIPDIVVYKDGGGRWRVINERTHRFFGFAGDEWLGKTDSELAAERPHFATLHEAFAARDAEAWSARRILVSHDTLTDAGGEALSLVIRMSATFEGNDAPRSLLVVARDETPLERAMHGEREALHRTEEVGRRAALAEIALVNLSEDTLRQIGRELHDDFGQLLTGAAMLADTVAHNLAGSHPADAATADRIVALLNDAVGKVRRISHGLYAAGLDDGALVPMFRSLGHHVESTGAIQVSFECEGDAVPLERGQALHLYRIVQEAATNVLRHSRAKRMSIEVEFEPGGLTIVVSDDGVGLPAQRAGVPNVGMGLQTMRHRAALIGASVEFDDVPGGGTRLTVHMPIEEEYV